MNTLNTERARYLIPLGYRRDGSPIWPIMGGDGRDGPEIVELDEDAVHSIADLVVEKIRQSRPDGSLAPNRTILGDVPSDGIIRKGGEAGAKFYGGDDRYTLAGRDARDVAVNLFLAKTVLETPNPKTGRPENYASDRLREVMVKSAEAAFTAGSPPIPAYQDVGDGKRLEIDPDGFATKSIGEWRIAVHEARTKAMVSTTAGSGDEWVPTFASAELWRDINFETIIAPTVRRVAQPTNPYDLPTLTASTTWYYAATENTSVTGSQPTTAKETLSAKKVQADVTFSGEVEEDSIVAAAPSIRADLVRSGAQVMDDLIVHGDTETGGTGNVNSDNAVRTANSFDLALNGMRKFCLVTNTAQVTNAAAALTSAIFNTGRTLLGKYGARASDLVIVVGGSTYLTMNVIAELITPDKYGPGATILRGEVARYFGIPVILSEAIPGQTSDKVEDDGKSNTAGGGAKGWLLLFNRRMWTLGFRRELRVESWRDIQKDSNILVASIRQAQVPAGVSSLHTMVIRNLTV